VIFLDWSRKDPAQTQGSPEEVRAAFEEAYLYFETHVRDLMGAILGAQVNGK
jgi:hypothetical protein